MLKALSQNKWKEKNWKLNLYGEGKDKLVLEKLIEELQLQSKVFLRGYTKDVKKALIESHLVLQITHMDGMPISVMEAMAMSKPVLISNVGDMAAWIKHGENGWVAESVTVEGIDKTLEQAWKQMSNWDETGKRSFEIFREKYPADPVIFFLEQTGILNEKSRKV